MNNIHPNFDQLLSQKDQEKLLNQKAGVYWLTGLSGSGKSTLAKLVEQLLYDKGHLVKVLDGDNIRSGINNDLAFNLEDRYENIRRVSEIAKLFKETGIIVICCFVSPTIELRNKAKEIIQSDFYEIFINASLETCENRDVKGLYKKARKGDIKDFTGISSPFEAPTNPSLEISTENHTIEASANLLFEFITK